MKILAKIKVKLPKQRRPVARKANSVITPKNKYTRKTKHRKHHEDN